MRGNPKIGQSMRSWKKPFAHAVLAAMVFSATGLALGAAAEKAMAKEPWEAAFEKKGWVRLGEAEVRKVMLNATLSPDGKGYQVYVAPDGAMIFRSFLGWTDKGKGEITKNGLFCRQWVNVRSGKKLCTSIWKKGGTYMSVKASGQVFRTLVISRGNPANL